MKHTVRKRKTAGRNDEQGIVVMLVAVFLLFVVGAMAALSIDVVTLYTARSEAQLAADAAALAAARVLANSGTTSDTTGASVSSAELLATAVAFQVAEQNSVGGRNLTATDVKTPIYSGSPTNPHVTVTVQRTDLPTFFARMWGWKQIAVAASATAEAYNPSGAYALGGTATPVAPMCVKPWLLPNLDPTKLPGTAGAIFNADGSIANPVLVGESWPWQTTDPNYNQNGLRSRNPAMVPLPGQYYPGLIDADDFPVPTQALPACSIGFTQSQLAVAGCVQRPISCGATATIKIDTNPSNSLDSDMVTAAQCLIHNANSYGDSDRLVGSPLPTPPFQFVAGSQNPVAAAQGQNVLVSDSLVTIPVFDSSGTFNPNSPVTVIGFLQVFLDPAADSITGSTQITATIINLAGCGTGATGTPIYGNGASPVAVRLITPP